MATVEIIVAEVGAHRNDRRARLARQPGADVRRDRATQPRDVLHGSNEPVLDLLTPPAGPLEVMTVGGLREAAFHQVLTSSDGQPAPRPCA